MKHLDSDIKTFINTEIANICDQIDYDVAELLPKRTEEFVAKVLKDDQGELCVNEEVHLMLHKFRRKAHRRGFKKIAVLGAFGHGKSLCQGTEVLMFSCKNKKVEDIKIDDLLMGDDGTPRKVLSLDRGREQAYKIILKNGDFFKCNASHKLPFYISNRWKSYKKGDQIVMTIQEYINLPEWVRKNVLKIQKAKLDFSKKEVKLNPYIYGVWLGDGHKTGLHFTINNEDKEIVNSLYSWANIHNFSIRVEKQIGDCTRYDLTKGSENSLPYKELSFIKSSIINGEKRIKKEYLLNSREFRLKLLAGLLDSDGHLFDNCYEWSTKYEGLKDDFLFLCRSLGFRVSYKVKEVEENLYYIVIVSGYTHLIPCKTRKKSSIRKQNKDPLVYGFDIEDIGEQDYYGVVLDKNHLYLQDDFTIHHNTEQICIGFVLEQIAKNPNILIKIVHISEKEAVNRVRAISEYIKNDPDFAELCPHIKPTSIWGQEKFIVKRKAISKDPTVAAYGVLASGLGGRAHLIIFDDINDLKSAVLEPTTRESVQQMFTTTWNTRLIPENSEVVLLGNRWHENDIFNYIQNNPIWAWMSIEVAEDKNGLIYKDSFGKVKPLPLWTKFPKNKLEDKHIEMGDRDYKRGYELKPYSDSDKTFPNFENCCRYGIKPVSVLGDLRDWIFGAGIDFAGLKRPGTIMIIGAMHKHTGVKLPIELYALEKVSDLPNKIVETWQKFGCSFYLAENNAIQDAVIDLLQTTIDASRFRKYNITIDAFNTGKNKADPQQGLPSIQKEFERGEWMFCFDHRFTPLDNDEKDLWFRFYQEHKHHPFYKWSDFVMATWFLREGFKKFFMKENISWIH